MFIKKLTERILQMQEEARQERIKSLGKKYRVNMEAVMYNFLLGLAWEELYNNEAFEVKEVTFETEDLCAYVSESSLQSWGEDYFEPPALTDEVVIMLLDALGCEYHYIPSQSEFTVTMQYDL